MDLVRARGVDFNPWLKHQRSISFRRSRPCVVPQIIPRFGRARVAAGSPTGNVLIPGIDQRSPWVRRCKDLIREHLSDLGGVENCSAAECSIVRRASVMTVELERMERLFALAGEASAQDLEIYARVAANMRRCLESIGIHRRPRDITPTLAEIIRQDAGLEEVR